MDTFSKPILSRTLSIQHWSVAVHDMVMERKCQKTAGTSGDWHYIVKRTSVNSPIIQYITFFQNKQVVSEIDIVSSKLMSSLKKKVRR